MPGPVVGIGLKELILDMVQYGPDGPWNTLLYYGPSPLPIIWAHLIRFLPAAVLFLWPVVRVIPRGYFEAGASKGRDRYGSWFSSSGPRRGGAPRSLRWRISPGSRRGCRRRPRGDAELGIVRPLALRSHALRRGQQRGGVVGLLLMSVAVVGGLGLLLLGARHQSLNKPQGAVWEPRATPWV